MASNHYLKQLGSTLYRFNNTDTSVVIRNILRHCSIDDLVRDEGTAYQDYTMRDDDSVESIADAVYGDVNFNWVILLINRIVNPFTDLPLNQESFEKFILKKYPGSAIFVRGESGNFQQTETLQYQSYETPNLGWDANYSRLIIDPKDDSPDVDDVITGGSSGSTATVKRSILNYESLHYFTRDGTYNGEVLSPKWIINDDDVYTSPNKYQNVEADISTGDDSILDAYILNTGNFDKYTVTHKDYEIEINEKKRQIKLLKPEYLPLLMNQLDKVLK